MTENVDTPDMAPVPPPYFWLWHLVAMGVIDVGLPDPAPDDAGNSGGTSGPQVVKGTRWDDLAGGKVPEARATVALIDTGTSRRHPNLAGQIDERSIDLTSHRYGARYAIRGDATSFTPETAQSFLSGLSTADLDLSGMAAADELFLRGLTDHFAASKGVVRQLAEPEEAISSHGTACAGLLVGHPALVDGKGPVRLNGEGANPSPNILPYFGVDPRSRLLSIRTSFEDDAVQFIVAFLYALSCKVQAIVLPRGLPDPKRSRLGHLFGTEPRQSWDSREIDDLLTRLKVKGAGPDPSAPQEGNDPDRLWRVLEQVVVAVSKKIPVFCAAGNDAESQVIYPANLSKSDNGIFAVGAVTALGRRSGYSNYGEGLTLVMPSDDYEVMNRHQKRIKTFDPLFGMHDYQAITTETEEPFSPLELVTTDLPGVFGYDRGTAPWSSLTDPVRNPRVGGGYYTAFGGTSGASCLAGGLALLAQRARLVLGKRALTGVEMKAAMLDSQNTMIRAVLPGGPGMQADRMNHGDSDGTSPSRHFGAGLPDAKKLIPFVQGLKV